MATPPPTHTDKKPADPCRCLTPEFRVAFPHIFSPEEEPSKIPGQPPRKKYRLTMLFPKSTDMGRLKSAANAAVLKKFGSYGNAPKGLSLPFKDGDEKDYLGFPGNIYMQADSNSKPGLLALDLMPILDEDQFYPGCWARATVTASYYEYIDDRTKAVMKRGVKFYLNNVQKIRDDTGFVGRSSAADDFAGAPGTILPPAAADFGVTGIAASAPPASAPPASALPADDMAPF